MKPEDELKPVDLRYLPENIRRRKLIKYSVAGFLLFTSLFVAYFFPYLVYAYENLRLTNYGIHYKSEPVSIDETETTFAEKISIISDMLQKSSFIYIDNREVTSTSIRAKLTADEAALAGVQGVREAFIDKYAELAEMDARDIQSKIFSSSEYYTQSYLMIKPDTKEMFLVWLVEYIEPSGNIEVFVDDETGKILSMVSNSSLLSNNLIGVMMYGYSTEMIQGLSDYYDMELVGNIYNTYEISGKPVTVCDIYFTDYPNANIEMTYSEGANLIGAVNFNFPYTVTANDIIIDEFEGDDAVNQEGNNDGSGDGTDSIDSTNENVDDSREGTEGISGNSAEDKENIDNKDNTENKESDSDGASESKTGESSSQNEDKNATENGKDSEAETASPTDGKSE